MRIGIVCPYSFDTPGGVQNHVRDLAEVFIGQGHAVSVLAPADDDTPLPDYVVAAGKAVPVRFNGSVARLNFGPMTNQRVARWLDAGNFDIVHLHEPAVPGLTLLALMAHDGPIVGTFHTSLVRSRALQAAYPLLRSHFEKIAARIAVSEDARRTLTTHLGGDAVVIPNGVFVDRYALAESDPRWTGTPQRPTICFLGRMEEPRKGMPVLGAALPQILQAHPGTRVLIAGPGGPDQVRSYLTPEAAAACEFLGMISDQDKAVLFSTADLYIAPNTGGESFGIILIEAMAAGATVVASDISAFMRVLDGGSCGATFRNEDSSDLAAKVIDLIGDPRRRTELSVAGRARADVFDWSVVAADVMAVYETVVAGAQHHASPPPTNMIGRLLRSQRRS